MISYLIGIDHEKHAILVSAIRNTYIDDAPIREPTELTMCFSKSCMTDNSQCQDKMGHLWRLVPPSSNTLPVSRVIHVIKLITK